MGGVLGVAVDGPALLPDGLLGDLPVVPQKQKCIKRYHDNYTVVIYSVYCIQVKA